MAANSVVRRPVLLKFELVLVTCKYEEDSIENECARVLTSSYVDISNTQGQPTLQLVVNSRDKIKTEGSRVRTTFLPL